MEFLADAEIDHVGQGCTIVHAHVILVLEALDLKARNTLRHRRVPCPLGNSPLGSSRMRRTW